jgi:hypothetical protein
VKKVDQRFGTTQLQMLDGKWLMADARSRAEGQFNPQSKGPKSAIMEAPPPDTITDAYDTYRSVSVGHL